jgi:hypothetical protein
MVLEDAPALAYSFGGNGTFVRTNAQANESVRHFAKRVFTDHFFAGMAAPKVDSGNMEKLAGRATEQLDQFAGMRTLPCFGNPK